MCDDWSSSRAFDCVVVIGGGVLVAVGVELPLPPPPQAAKVPIAERDKVNLISEVFFIINPLVAALRLYAFYLPTSR